MKTNDIIRALFPNMRTQDLANKLGLTYSQVANRAYSMGLRKSEEFKQSDKSGMNNFIEAGKRSRFTKGHTPVNKGKKMSQEIYDKCKHTMWKAGHRPHNWKPDGSIVERNDKTGKNYLYYKVKDSQWILYHNKIWSDHHGKIPAKHIVTFKDGNTFNCDISNLELMSMADNARRNTIHRFPEDVQQVIRLKAKLTKKIKEHGQK